MSDQSDQLQAQLATLQAQRDRYKAVLVAAEYEQIDEISTQSLELCTALGELAKQRYLDLQAQLRQVEGERDEAKGNYDRACMTIASMHSAAVGTVGNGPKRGVVEDVEDLRTAYTTLRQLVEALPVVPKEYLTDDFVHLGVPVTATLWAQIGPDLIALLTYRASLPAQPAQGGA